MTNLDIETFWAVVQHGTMTAAAEALYITQPTLSMRIRALEERGARRFSSAARASAVSGSPPQARSS